ncbi:MAG TPA: hypothetical protein VGC45_00070 [Gryllotalpicola sp.]
METPLCPLGHLVPTAELRRRGFGPRALAALRRDPRCSQPRRGWYACAHLAPDELLAASCGARIDCVSALRARGVWIGDARGALHLRLPASGGRTAQRSAGLRRRVVVHWRKRAGHGSPLYVSTSDALRQAMQCLPPDDLVAAIESAVHLGRISKPQARRLVASAPHRLAGVLGEIDPEFRAQSGYETKVRLRFRRLGYRVEPQAAVPGVGHLDNLIEGVIAVETDGRDHDTSRSTDYFRDLWTAAWGIRVLRVDPALVDRDWPAIQGVVEQIVAEARLLRRLRGRDLDGAPRRRRGHAD